MGFEWTGSPLLGGYVKMRSGWQEVNTRDTVYGNEDSSTKEKKWVKEQNKVLCDQSTGDKEDKEWYHI